MFQKRVIAIIVSSLILFAFIFSTDPNKVSLLIILVPFILLGVIIYNILTLVIEKFLSTLNKERKTRLFALIGTIIFINFILLSSIGQLTPQDTILAVLITIVGGFYLYKFQIG